MRILSTKDMLEDYLAPREYSPYAPPAVIGVAVGPLEADAFLPGAFGVDIDVKSRDPLPGDHAILVRRLLDKSEIEFVFCVRSDPEPTLVGVFEIDEGVLSGGSETPIRMIGIYPVAAKIAVPLPSCEDMRAFCSALETAFYAHVNGGLKDPFLFDAVPRGEGLTFAYGDEASFRRSLEDVLNLCIGTDEEARVHIDTEELAPYFEVSRHLRDTAEVLFDALLRIFSPQGTAYIYNDGPRGRVSGYTEGQYTFSITIRQPSALARADSLTRLTTFFSTRDARLAECLRGLDV